MLRRREGAPERSVSQSIFVASRYRLLGRVAGRGCSSDCCLYTIYGPSCAPKVVRGAVVVRATVLRQYSAQVSEIHVIFFFITTPQPTHRNPPNETGEAWNEAARCSASACLKTLKKVEDERLNPHLPFVPPALHRQGEGLSSPLFPPSPSFPFLPLCTERAMLRISWPLIHLFSSF